MKSFFSTYALCSIHSIRLKKRRLISIGLILIITCLWSVVDHKGIFNGHVTYRRTSLQIEIPDVRRENYFKDCQALFRKDSAVTVDISTAQARVDDTAPGPRRFDDLSYDCDGFKRNRKYITDPITIEEAEFSIAFSIMVYTDSDRFERLLRMVYRPQNYYCVHVDSKSSEEFHEQIMHIVNCFPNAFMSSKRYNVVWGTITVLDADVHCMRDLLRYKEWKYLINLTGQEAPLKTNYELVKILKTYNGANDIEGTIQRREGRFHNPAPPPDGLTIVKGSVHITACRGFVEYVIKNPIAIRLHEWLAKDTYIPDEALFSTIHHNPQLGAPGAYIGEHETDPVKLPFMTRFKNWGHYPFDYPCAGQFVKDICALSVGDLPFLSKRPELFANKFRKQYSPLAYDCLEERHFNRTRDDYAGSMTFNLTFYQSLPFVRSHV